MKLLFEAGKLLEKRKTGVGYYASYLEGSLRENVANLEIIYGAEGNLGDLKPAIKATVPRRLWIKLLAYGVRLPYNFVWPASKVDAAIFPDYNCLSKLPWSKTKIAVTVHDLGFLKHPGFINQKHHNRFLNWLLPSGADFLKKTVSKSCKKADLVIAISETMKQELIDLLNIDGSKIVTTPIPPSLEYRPAKTSSKKAIKGINKEYIYFQATIEPRKNHAKLIDAYCMLPKDLRDKYALVLGGGRGWLDSEVMAAVTQKVNQGYDIRRLGYVGHQQKIRLYQQASLYVQPSFYEGFGMPLLESMACGTPVVCSDIEVFREVCQDAAIYFDPDNPGSIAKNLAKALNLSPKTKTSLVKDGLSRAAYYRDDSAVISELADRLRPE